MRAKQWTATWTLVGAPSGVALPQNWQVDLGSQQQTFKCVNIVWEKTADHYTFQLAGFR